MLSFLIPKIASMKAGLTGEKIKHDALGGAIVGLESVPDGLATGVLAGVNPVAGVYGSVYGFLGGVAFSRTSFMAVQTTGAMAIIVADQNLASLDNPAGALTTITLLTGILMLAATLGGAAKLLRYIPNAVLVGFVNAVGLNIILGQIGDLTGYSSDQSHRLLRVWDTITHPGDIQLAVFAVGIASIAMMVVFSETKLGSMGILVAVAAASALSYAIGGPTQTLADITDVPSSIPLPRLPSIGAIPTVIVGAISLTFVGLVQGAGVASGLPEPDDTAPNPKRDFGAQSMGNVISSFFGGMPVGGSLSGSALMVTAGAKSRMSYLYASVAMILTMVTLAGIISRVAMPALAGLLLIVGVESLKPHRAKQVIQAGRTDTLTMIGTFVLCLILPVQYAVLAGVAIAFVLNMVEYSSGLKMRRIETNEQGFLEETDVPEVLGAGEVVVLQPYGNLFFGSAPTMRHELPQITAETKNSVVILRLRGLEPVGFAITDELKRYSSTLRAADSKLAIVSDDNEALDQFDMLGLTARLGDHNVYRGSKWFGDTTLTAVHDAQAWVAARG